MTQLSIVILHYNAEAFLEICLSSVVRATQDLNVQIIVADNNSDNNNFQLLSNIYPHVDFIYFDENHGFSKGNNLAIKQATGKYLCILNPDTLIAENTFTECISFLEKTKENIGFVGTRLIDGSGYFLPESKRNVPTPPVARNKFFGNGQLYYANHVKSDERGAIPVLVGAFMFCRKDVFHNCGGFDERYFMYGEDIDLSYTALQKGFINYYLGDLTTIHFKGESTIKDKVYFKQFYGAMSLFYDKYFKQSFVEKWLVKLLVTIFSLLKFNQKSKKQKSQKSIFLISNDANFRISGIPDTFLNESLHSILVPQHSKIIWDLKSLTGSEIINFMALNTHKNISYRFVNENRTFYIGSDYSTSRGVVKKISQN